MTKLSSARKVVTRSPVRNVGIINCRWFQDHPIEYESQLEKRFVQSALLCPGIREIRSQPFTMKLEIGSYTPDFLIDFGSGRAVIEIKPRSKVTKFSALFDQAAQHLKERSLHFYVITEEGIDCGNHVKVAGEVLRYGKAEIAEEQVYAVLQVFGAGEDIRLADLVSRTKVKREVVLHMLARRWLRIRSKDLVEDQTLISRVQYTPELDIGAFEQRFLVLPWAHSGLSAPDRPPRSNALKKRATRSVGPYVRENRTASDSRERNPLSFIAAGL